MNVFDAYLQDKPSAFYKFDHTGTSFPNQMGDSRAMTSTTAVSRALNTPIVTGSAGPVLVSGSNTLKIPTNRLSPSSKMSPVSLECWALPLGSPVSIMSHDGTDGLTFDGDKIRFVVELENQGAAEASWIVPDYISRYHLVGVFDGNKASLYVDGILESEIDLTQDQQSDSLKLQADENLYTESSSGGILIDAPAIYEYALSSQSVLNHYLAGSNGRGVVDNVMSFGGLAWTFDDFDRNIVMSSEVELSSGTSVSTTYLDGVRPTVDDTLVSEAGTWTTSIPIAASGLDLIDGVKVAWEGDGLFVVEASFDLGLTWTAPLDNGQLVPGSVGIGPTDKEIDVRVSFDGGVQNDISVIRQLSYVVYPDSIIRSDNSTRTVTLNDDIATSSVISEPLDSYQNAGLRIPAGATATINPDVSEDPQDTQTIEMLFKIDAMSDGAIIDGLSITGGSFNSTGTAYFNGSTTIPTPVQDQWIHVVIVIPASNDPITIGGGPAINVGMVAIYHDALTADKVLRLYTSYFGNTVASIGESSSVSVQESDEMYNLYDYDWQIISGGR